MFIFIIFGIKNHYSIIIIILIIYPIKTKLLNTKFNDRNVLSEYATRQI